MVILYPFLFIPLPSLCLGCRFVQTLLAVAGINVAPAPGRQFGRCGWPVFRNSELGAQNAKTIDTTYVSTIYAKTHTSRRSLVMQYGVPLIPSDNWVSGFLYHKYKQEHMQKPSSPII